MSCTLADWGNLSSIFTALIAAVGVLAYFRSLYTSHKKSMALENFLRAERAKGPGHGMRSITRIIQEVGLTEDEILKISFTNDNIRRRVTVDKETQRAGDLLFEFDPDYKNSK